MAEKASSIIGHRRSQAGTNLSHPEEAPGEQSGTSSQTPPVNPSPVYPSTPRQAFQKPGSGYKKGEKSFLAKLFSFSGRMGRLAYFVLVVISDFYLFSFTSLPDDVDELYYGCPPSLGFLLHQSHQEVNIVHDGPHTCLVKLRGRTDVSIVYVVIV